MVDRPMRVFTGRVAGDRRRDRREPARELSHGSGRCSTSSTPAASTASPRAPRASPPSRRPSPRCAPRTPSGGRAIQEHPVRAEIEAFARSISHGVTLDFAWAYEVAGVTSDALVRGHRGVLAGRRRLGPHHAEPASRRPGATRTRRPWSCTSRAHAGDPRGVRAVFADAGSDHEAWATAWAIGMGYDLPGPGSRRTAARPTRRSRRPRSAGVR